MFLRLFVVFLQWSDLSLEDDNEQSNLGSFLIFKEIKIRERSYENPRHTHSLHSFFPRGSLKEDIIFDSPNNCLSIC